MLARERGESDSNSFFCFWRLCRHFGAWPESFGDELTQQQQSIPPGDSEEGDTNKGAAEGASRT